MTKDLWTVGFLLLNTFVHISEEYEINPEVEGYDQGNLQNDGSPGMMVLPQDCFEVCNDYDCLYLCPEPIRGVKRCITPLKSNKKNCCQNDQKQSSTLNDNTKTAGKHVWQAREQYLLMKKDLENDLANKRYSLLKGLQPFALRQHNYSKDSLLRTGTKISKLKTNNGQLVCPGSDRKITNPAPKVENTNHALLNGFSVVPHENEIPPKLELARENESDKDEPWKVLISTTVVPMVLARNENIEEAREHAEVSTQNLGSVIEGTREIQNSFTDVRDSIQVSGTEHVTLGTQLQETSYNDHNSPNARQNHDKEFLNRRTSLSSIVTDQTYYDKDIVNESTISNSSETEMAQSKFQTDSLTYYGESQHDSPLENKNQVLSQHNHHDLSYTTPLVYALSSSYINKSFSIGLPETAAETYDSPLAKSQDAMLTTPVSITDVRDRTLVPGTECVSFGTHLREPSYDDHNSPNARQNYDKEFFHQRTSSSSIVSDQTNIDKDLVNESTSSNRSGSEMVQSSFHTDSLAYYEESPQDSPLVNKNPVLSQYNHDDLSYTTPFVYARSSSYLNQSSTLENPGIIAETYDSSLDNIQGPMLTTPGSIEDNQREMNENILVQAGGEFMANDSKSYIYTENEESLSTHPTKENGELKSAKSEESAWSLDTSEVNMHQSLSQREVEKTEADFILRNETGIGNKINEVNTSGDNFYIEREKMEDSPNILYGNEQSYDYFRDDSSPNVNETLEKNGQVYEIKLSSEGDRFQTADKNSSLESLTTSADDKKQDYSYRIYQEIISRYNITNYLNESKTKAPHCPTLNTSLGHKRSDDNLVQERPQVNSSLTDQSTGLILQNKQNENESYFTTYKSTHSQWRQKSIISREDTNMSKLNVENERKAESMNMTGSSELNNEQILSELSKKSIYNIHNSGYEASSTYQNSSNILKSYSLNYVGENTTSGLPETITGIAKDNVSNTIIVDNENEISLDNGNASSNRTLINTSHSQASRTASVYPVQKGLIENLTDIDRQLVFHPNKREETIFHNLTLNSNEELQHKNTNFNENQFYVENDIKGPLLGNDFALSNESVNGTSSSENVDQQLLYDDAGFEPTEISSSNNNLSSISHQIGNIAFNGSLDEQLCNKTEGNILNHQDETILQLIENKSEMQFPITVDNERDELKNHDVEEVYLQLDENSIRNADSDFDKDLHKSQSSDGISTELHNSESYVLGDKRDDSRKLNEIINTELNSMKQQTVILKKREEEMSSGDDSQCECDYPVSRDAEPERNLRSNAMNKAYVHPFYPMFLVVPIPYNACDCKNQTTYTLNGNYINPPEHDVSRDGSKPLPDYSSNSVYNNFNYGQAGKAGQVPPYMPNLFFPFFPWGGTYSMISPYNQAIDQYENELQTQEATDGMVDKLDHAARINPSSEELRNSNPSEIFELHQESEANLKASETKRISRNEQKESVANEYVFIDGQYVKVSVYNEDAMNGDMDRNFEETSSTVTEPSTVATSTAYHISQESFPIDQDETGPHYRPVDYRYFNTAPDGFRGGQYPLDSYLPAYFFGHHR